MALTDYSTRFANFRKNPASLGARSIRKQIPTGPQNLAQALSGLGQEFFASKMESDAREKFEEDEGIRKGIENQVASILMSPNVASDVSRNQQVENIYRNAPFPDMQKEALSRTVKRQDAEEARKTAITKFKKEQDYKTDLESLKNERRLYAESNPSDRAYPKYLKSLPNFQQFLKQDQSQPTVTKSTDYKSLLKAAEKPEDIFNLVQARSRRANSVEAKSNMDEIVKKRGTIETLDNSDMQINQVLSLYDRGATTGFGSEFGAKVRSVGLALGMDVDKNKLASVEGFRTLGLQFVQNAIQLTKGAISEKEMDLFRDGSINVGNTKQGNMLIAKMMTHANNAKRRLAQLETQMLQNNVSENDRYALRSAMITQLRKENIWNDAERRLLTQAAGSKGKIPDRVGSTTTQQIGEEEVTIQEVSN